MSPCSVKWAFATAGELRRLGEVAQLHVGQRQVVLEVATSTRAAAVR